MPWSQRRLIQTSWRRTTVNSRRRPWHDRRRRLLLTSERRLWDVIRRRLLITSVRLHETTNFVARRAPLQPSFSATLLTRDITVQSFDAVTRLDDLTQWRFLPNDVRCAWRALVFIVFGYAGGEGREQETWGTMGRGKGMEGEGRGVGSRFGRIWCQIVRFQTLISRKR